MCIRDSVSLPVTRYPTGPQQVQFFEQLVDRLEARPQVRQAALAIGCLLYTSRCV